MEESTTDIAQMLGVIDPWYKRNVLSLLSLTPHVLCQVSSILASLPFSAQYIVFMREADNNLIR